MSENRPITTMLWPLEDIERELMSIISEARHLPPGTPKERIDACAKAALETLREIISGE